MDKIRQWTLTLSAISIISGLILVILPQGTNKKLFKVIVSVIMIYAALQPIIGMEGIDFNIGDYLKDNYRVSENIDKYALSAMINSAEKAIENLLAEKAEEMNLNFTFSCVCSEADGEISVEKIIVSPKADENEKEIIESIIESLGFDKSIIIYEVEGNEH